MIDSLLAIFFGLIGIILGLAIVSLVITLAFDMSIPEIIEWWDERKENRK